VCSIWTLGVYLLNDYIRGELIKIPLLMSLLSNHSAKLRRGAANARMEKGESGDND
jgi:hypothetical protein